VIPDAYIKAVKLEKICAPVDTPIVIVFADTSMSVGGYGGYAFVVNKACGVVLYHPKIDGKNTSLNGLSLGIGSNIYVQRPIVRNTKGIGIRVKTDPDTSDIRTFFPYVMPNIWIDSADVANTGAEGGYFGHSLTGLEPYNGKLPQVLQNFTLTHWKSRRTGWDGVQISGAFDASVHDVDIDSFGTAAQPSQMNGFVSGGSVTYRDTITDISIKNGPGSGFAIFSRGKIIARHVRTQNAGTKDGESGVYIDDFVSRYDQPVQQVELYDVIVDSAAKAPLFYYNKYKTALPIVVKGFSYQRTHFPITDNSHGLFKDTGIIVTPPVVIIPPVDTPVVIVPPVVVDDTIRITGNYTLTKSNSIIKFTGTVASKLTIPDKPAVGFSFVIQNTGKVNLAFNKRVYFLNGQYRLMIKPGETMWLEFRATKKYTRYIITKRLY
jgi:hypothetical protein